MLCLEKKQHTFLHVPIERERECRGHLLRVRGFICLRGVEKIEIVVLGIWKVNCPGKKVELLAMWGSVLINLKQIQSV